MKLSRIIKFIDKEITQYFHFPIPEIISILIITIFSLNTFSLLSHNSLNLEHMTGGRLFSIYASSKVIDTNINRFLHSLGLCNINSFPVLLAVVLTALTIGEAFEKGRAVTMLSYPISRIEFILNKILTILIVLMVCLIMPIVLVMLSVFPIRGVLIIGLLGWCWSLVMFVILTSLMAITFRRSLPAILTTLFISFFIELLSTNLGTMHLMYIFNPSEVLIGYFYPASLSGLFINMPDIKDVLLSIGTGFLVLIGCTILLVWRIKNMDVK